MGVMKAIDFDTSSFDAYDRHFYGNGLTAGKQDAKAGKDPVIASLTPKSAFGKGYVSAYLETYRQRYGGKAPF